MAAPADRRHFRDMTVGKPVVMGRKTFETLKRPLGKRLNIILTRNVKYEVPSGCLVAHSVDDVLAIAADAEELMILRRRADLSSIFAARASTLPDPGACNV